MIARICAVLSEILSDEYGEEIEVKYEVRASDRESI